ncbi:MAG: phosphoadenosine phosphosulfate reductase family protein [Nitrososphaeraceae archaeon]|nr:phosphoadenosine phosphosulfate reductase family protein [Nitrososphaeraceae archaeon]
MYHDLIEKTIDFIKSIKEYKTAIFFNGGKDSVVMMDLIKRAYNNNLDIPIIFVEKPDEFPEMLEFIESLELNIIKVKDMKESIRDLMDKDSITHIFTGIRHNDPYGSKTNMIQMTDKDWPQVYLVNPLIKWEYHDIWYYIFDRDLEYCKLYDQGYTSLGQIGNTFKNSLLFNSNHKKYQAAYKLKDGKYERYGRINCTLPLTLEGPVVHGQKNGKKIGFPTANINTKLEKNVKLDYGVYYGIIDFSEEEKEKKFVMSYGQNTLYWDSKYTTLELHILDLQTEDFYGKILKFEIKGYIRPMEKLVTVPELVDAINQDIEIARWTLSSNL